MKKQFRCEDEPFRDVHHPWEHVDKIRSRDSRNGQAVNESVDLREGLVILSFKGRVIV